MLKQRALSILKIKSQKKVMNIKHKVKSNYGSQSGTQETDISILDLKIIKSKFIMMMELKD